MPNEILGELEAGGKKPVNRLSGEGEPIDEEEKNKKKREGQEAGQENPSATTQEPEGKVQIQVLPENPPNPPEGPGRLNSQNLNRSPDKPDVPISTEDYNPSSQDYSAPLASYPESGGDRDYNPPTVPKDAPGSNEPRGPVADFLVKEYPYITPEERQSGNIPPEFLQPIREFMSKPRTPEDYERFALKIINFICQRDEQRAKERYRGPLFGAIKRFFNREGRRREAEVLERAGEWQSNPKWKKWLKIGAKILGGFGAAAAMTFTGGAGLFLTPFLWTAGVREGWDGILQAVEEIGWGRHRSRHELEAQQVLSQKIEELKRVTQEQRREIDPQQLYEALIDVLKTEQQLIEHQHLNMQDEDRWATIRGVASTALTIGTGAFLGIPFGTAQHSVGATGHPTEVITAAGRHTGVFLDPSHRVFWNLKDGLHYLYNSQEEMLRVANVFNQHLNWQPFWDTFGRAAHSLGHGLAPTQIAGLAAGGIYTISRWLEQYFPKRKRWSTLEAYMKEYPYRKEKTEETEYTPPSAPEYETAGYGEEKKITKEKRIQQEREAVAAYLKNLQETDPAYYEEIMKEAKDKPMSENCRATICVPAVPNEDFETLLRNFLGQKDLQDNPLPPDSFEVNILVNDLESKKEDIENAVKKIDELKNKEEFKDLKINIILKPYKEPVPIGQIRKLLTDVVLARSSNREKQNEPLVIISNDADLRQINKDYIARHLKAYEDNPDLAIVAGKADFPEEEYKKYPYLLATVRLLQAADTVLRNRKVFLPKTMGNNSSFTAEIYAKVGGYDKNHRVAEDLELAERIARKAQAEGRKSEKAIEYHGIDVIADPRRYVAAIEKGLPVVKAYRDFHENRAIREAEPEKKRLEALTDINAAEFQKALEEEATNLFNYIKGRIFDKIFDNQEEVKRRRAEQGKNAKLDDLVGRLVPEIEPKAQKEAGELFKEIMRLWGADYNIIPGRTPGVYSVQFKDWTKLKRGLEAYLQFGTLGWLKTSENSPGPEAPKQQE